MICCPGSALTLVFPWISSSCQSLFEVSSPPWLGTALSGAAVPVYYEQREGGREEEREEGREGGREGGRKEGGGRIFIYVCLSTMHH